MENYKKKIQKKLMLLSLLCIICGVILTLNIFDMISIESNHDFISGAISGFQEGLVCAIIVLCIIQIVRFNKALKDEEKLKKLYNKENDERIKYIKQKCGANVIIFTTIITIIAAVIAVYFNRIVFFSLLACALLQITVCAVLKIYYLKKC
ncbi:hypothetical protein JYG23_04710 [Sedimentibacter sp. zth1]|uniref:hypothetical protein n=1 Tax=Sedimentibacter sp. zth1 TaxID=2816908 RepID=UPI001A915CBE|nr:hypothetical protein [Sedimentibacter sp. zth1]QSX06751.1 hypothetical protein JYG23_04710 [Sedimentibacter sp. zth1]